MDCGCDQISQDTACKRSDRPTTDHVIRAQDGHAECCLNWNVYDIGVNLFKPSGAKWLHYKVFKAILV